MSLYAQPVNAISVLPLTHHLSEEEQALMPLWTAGRERSTPPLGPVRPVAEFEPLTSVLVRYPLGFPVNLIKQFAEEITVVTIVGSESVKNQAISAYNAAQVNMANCKFMIGATNSYWTRDYGPWFAFDGNNQLSVIDFTYNRPRPLDDALIPIYATYDTLSCYTMSISQTGGNYMTDGISKAASSHIAYTENGNNQTNVDNQMLQYLGVEDYHVLQDPNNTYIDHIDCWGKFLGPDKILIRSVPTSHAQYNALEQMAQYWSNQMSSYNRPFRVYRVYTPNNQPYTNSVILNNRVFVPIMNNSNDAAALQTYRDAMPGYTIIGVLNSSSTPWESTDALHCRTHEIPDRRMLYISHTPLSYDQDL
ncbi:MAG: agmatine deiminase family protein, partial [Candidatus Cloacimonetes bacterium]|nr:agmatine deiminase family protein [Candidatus Cloacimonadota bacterium]